MAQGFSKGTQVKNPKLKQADDGSQSSTRALVTRVLSNPELFPDEFKAWLPRWLNNNVNVTVSTGQLPTVDGDHYLDTARFENGWTNYGGTNASAGYYKDPWGRVFLKGTVTGGTLNSIIFTLPAGYRPKEAEVFVVMCNNTANGLITVNPDGSVTMSAGGSNASLTLSGISFRQYS